MNIGSFVSFKLDSKNKYDNFDNFFIGFCVVGTFLNFWSLFLPTNIFAFIILLAISLLLLYISFKNNNLFLKNNYEKIINVFIKQKSFSLSILLLFVIILFTSLVTPRLFDSHLYHIGSIKWNEMYRVVPGLANFHDRFGFNSSVFVMSAAFTFESFFKQSLYLLSSVTLLVFFVWLIKIVFDKKGLVAILCLFFIYFFYEQYYLDISSPSSDLIPNILISYVFFKLLILEKMINKQYLIIIILPIFCITLKLSTLPIILISFYAIYLKNNNNINFIKQLTLISIVFILPWIIRNIIITGYVLYPFESLDFFNFDWKVPVENVIITKESIYAWARIPFFESNYVLEKSFSEWIIIWWEMTSLKNRRFFIIALISPFILLFLYFRNKRVLNKNILFSFIICYFSFIFWLLKAPDFRFSFSFILLLNVFVYSHFFNHKFFLNKKINHLMIIITFSTLIILSKKSFALFTEDYKISEYTSYIFKPLNYKKYVENTKAEFIENEFKFKNNNSIILYSTPEINYFRCFDVVPCSAYLNENIKLRGNTLQNGFKYEK